MAASSSSTFGAAKAQVGGSWADVAPCGCSCMRLMQVDRELTIIKKEAKSTEGRLGHHSSEETKVRFGSAEGGKDRFRYRSTIMRGNMRERPHQPVRPRYRTRSRA